MVNKFSETLSLLWNNLGLFTAIILTVWLPGNILKNFVAYSYVEVGYIWLIRLPILIEGIFGPIYIGALVYALFQIKLGRTVNYKDAIAVGFKKWGSLFTARLVAGLRITLGFIALVIPGIILAVRYSLLDAAVIVENKDTADSRSRSIALTVGRRWQIFGAVILFIILSNILSFIIYLPLDYLPLDFFEPLNIIPVMVTLDCISDVFFAVVPIVLFLFYWESIQQETNAEPAATADGVPAAAQP
jgi:hypothetical protein